MKLLVIAGLLFAVPQQRSETPFKIASNNKDLTPESLLQPVVLPVSDSLHISVEPGLKVISEDGCCQLSSYTGSKIEVRFGDEFVRLPSPATLRYRDANWDLGFGKIYQASSITARLSVQDDTDTNLKSMQESAKKLKSRTDSNQDNGKGPTKKLKVRWLYGENPNPTSELFNSAAIQQLTHVSPVGF